MTAPPAPAGPAALPAAAGDFYAFLASLSASAATSAAQAWDTLDPADLVGSWNRRAMPDRLLVATALAQRTGAAAAQRYVAEAVRAQTGRREGAEVALDAIAGVASDGRDLDDLLLSPLTSSLDALGRGETGEAAKELGRNALATIVRTQVTDAGRTTATIAMAAEPRVTGYVRMLTLPSCGRCAVLAGRVYRWSSGFERHPRCDCVHIPAVEDSADDLRTDPEAYFWSLTADEQDRYFTKSGAEAIRLGADLGQVVNARRGARGFERPGRLTNAEAAAMRGGKPARLQRVDVFGRQLAVTNEGTTRRGLGGQRLIAEQGTQRTTRSRYRRARAPRLMPEAILQIADGDRDLAQSLLRKHGYLL